MRSYCGHYILVSFSKCNASSVLFTEKLVLNYWQIAYREG